MALYFSNSFSSFIGKEVNFLSSFPSLILKALTYPLILGNIKTNGFITSSKYSIKYLEWVFASINFDVTTLLILKCQIFTNFFVT